jgi:transcriptional regulator with XRE-family HTH domain
MAEATTFGEWLKRRRGALGLTQEQLAQHIGCSTIALRKIEAEERRPSEPIVKRLAEVLGLRLRTDRLFRFARGDWQAAPAAGLASFPWRTVRSNLPAPLTSLIGREHDVAMVRGYLLTPDVRLITLIGLPGIGKTRLSVRCHRRCLTSPMVRSSSHWKRSRMKRASHRRLRMCWAWRRTIADRMWNASKIASANGDCCWCWTTSSRSSRLRRWCPICCRPVPR